MIDVRPGIAKHIDSAATTLVKTGAGILRRIVVNTTAAGTTEVFDKLTAAAPLIALLKSGVGEGTYEYNCRFGTGLTVKTGHADQDITVVYE